MPTRRGAGCHVEVLEWEALPTAPKLRSQPADSSPGGWSVSQSLTSEKKASFSNMGELKQAGHRQAVRRPPHVSWAASSWTLSCSGRSSLP